MIQQRPMDWSGNQLKAEHVGLNIPIAINNLLLPCGGRCCYFGCGCTAIENQVLYVAASDRRAPPLSSSLFDQLAGMNSLAQFTFCNTDA